MRHGAATLLVILGLLPATVACSGRPPPRLTTVSAPIALSATATIPARALAAVGVACGEDTDCRQAQNAGKVPIESGKEALCENGKCLLVDAAITWDWAKGVFSELRLYDGDAPDLSWASWFKQGASVTLFVQQAWLSDEPLTHQSHCVALRLAESEGELVARIDDNGRSCVPPRSACRYELRLGDLAVVNDASNSLLPDEPRYVGEYLSDVDESSVAYDGAMTKLIPYCSELVIEQPGCVPERCSSCQLGFTSEASGINGAGGSVRLEDTVHKVTDGSCAPCPPDPLRPLLPRLKTVLEARRFRTPFGDPRSLRLYRRRPDCEAHLQELVRLDE